MKSASIPVSCSRDCGGGCPLVAHLLDGRIHRIGDNPLRPKSMRGCARGYKAHRAAYSPDRLTKPLIRRGESAGGGFRQAGWEEALDLVAERLLDLRARYGPSSIMHIGGSGSARGAVHNTGSLTARFLALFGGCTSHVGTYSSAAERYVTPFLFGTNQAGMDAATLLHSRFLLLLGANIVDTRFGCELESFLRKVKNRGVPIMVFDPRRTRTAERLATEWIPILPGTDSALLAAFLFVLQSEDLIDREFIQTYSIGWKDLLAYLTGKTDGEPKNPRWAEHVCGVPAARIIEIARRYGKSKPAALIPGLSVQRNIGGEEAIRMAAALQVATGNVGIPGGSSGSNMWGRLPTPRCGRIGVPRDVSADIRSVPVYRWPDAVLEGKAGGFPSDTHGLYVVGGNYVSTGSDVRKNIRAFQSVQFAVCHDLFLTPTAQCCDVVLPATTFLEREDLVFPEGNYLFYSGQAIQPVGQARDDYSIFSDLAERLGFGEAFTENRSAPEWLEWCLRQSEVKDAEAFKRTGMYFGDDRERMSFSDFIGDPQGKPLNTPSGKIELSSTDYGKTGFPHFPTYRGFRPDARYPLSLVTPHARYRVNSQNSNDPWFSRLEEQLCWMHSDDARARGIKQGQRVAIYNEVGRTEVSVRIVDGIMPGVVCLPAGQWSRVDADGVDRLGCANMLSSTEPTLPSQGSRTHSIGVEVIGIA